MDRPRPIPRTGARVLVIDAHERVLLMSARDPSDGVTVWMTPGGTVEPGESLEDAARRELAEEVDGLPPPRLEGPVWRRFHRYAWDGREHEVTCWFFVARYDEPLAIRDVRETGPAARDSVGWRWWTLAELAAFDGIVAPRRIAELLPAILRGERPDPPIDSGV